ncbi:hypothetical protein GBA52_017132 [Prunus armeniaca]|nr:hypothetical protein GBA52_017132 [Prunus armeniaca]
MDAIFNIWLATFFNNRLCYRNEFVKGAWSSSIQQSLNGHVWPGMEMRDQVAYASFMKGSLLFEKYQNWETARH